MATIDITRPHSLTKDDARKKAEELAQNLQSKIGIAWRWVDDTIHFEAAGGAAKGVKGLVAVTDKDVNVQVDLPFLLKMMKGTIEEKVNEKLSQLL